MKRPSLNHVYRLVWSDILGAFVAVAEGSRGKGKSGDRLLATVLLGSVVLSASAAPTGGVVTSGTAAISQSGAVTNINQSTQKAAINWQGFSIGASETVNFNQPNSSAITLNRVIGNEKSVIEGALNANGKVFLINSNGMLFAKGSSVNTGGFVGSTLNLTDEDFNAGKYVFKGNGGSGSVINMGTINARDGGYVALLGNSVSNQGVISATKGTVALNGGNRITLNFNGDSLLSVTIDEGALNALVENKQAIYADGGKIIMTAKAADDLLSAQVNNSGLVQARTLDDLKGSIELYAHGGTAHVDGTLDASAPKGGDGGFIETSGDRVKIADSAFITTKSAYGKNGLWLIDPVDFTIAASGGDITGRLLSNLLDGGSIAISSTAGSNGTLGDINVNDAITWGSNSVLTLTAVHDININAPITATGASAGLVMNYGHDYNIRTKASYSGVADAPGLLYDKNGKPVLDMDGHQAIGPVAKQDTSGGVYGKISFTACVDAASCANTRLTINGQAYTLVGSMSQLEALDKIDAMTGYWYNPVTGNYDVSVVKVDSYFGFRASINKVLYYFDPATGTYSIPNTAPIGGATRYYNPETGAYDRTTQYPLKRITQYWFNPSTGRYDIANASTISGAIKYYNPYTGQYDLSGATTPFAAYYYNPESGRLDLPAPYLLPSANIAIAHDLDASGITYAHSVVSSLNGTLAGLGNTVSNLTISAPSDEYVGLIGQAVDTTTLRDIGLVNANVTGNKVVGSLLGGTTMSATTVAANTTLLNAYVTKTINGTSVMRATNNSNGVVGGLAGQATTIKYAFSDADVVGGAYAGGLAGGTSLGQDTGNTVFVPSEVSHAHATGTVTGVLSGGLIGRAIDTAVDYVYATGDVNWGAGLIGSLELPNPDKSPYTISVKNSFAIGNVVGSGGLIGTLGASYYALSGAKTITIDNVYATGNVTADSAAEDGFSGVGGLIGTVNLMDGIITSTVLPNLIISNAHASGNVIISGMIRNAGGLIGIINAKRTTDGSTTACCGLAATITNSYATGNVDASRTTGYNSVGGLIGAANQASFENVNYKGTVTGGNLSDVGGGAVRRTPANLTNSILTPPWSEGGRAT